MFNISNFLEKFLKIQKSNLFLIETIISGIKKNTNIDLKESEIEITDNFIKIKSNPVFRNEIFMKKEKIESFLKSNKIYLKLY